MSKALVLVAGLYVFLALIWDKQERETCMKGSNKQGQGQRHHKQIELLAVAFVLLFSCLFIHYFSFFSTFFFHLYFWYIFFSSKEHTRTNHKKCELNWIKDVVYTKSELCSQMHAKLVDPETQFSWSNFAILIFANLVFLGWNISKIFCSSP